MFFSVYFSSVILPCLLNNVGKVYENYDLQSFPIFKFELN